MLLNNSKLRNMEKNSLISHVNLIQQQLVDSYEENTFLQSKFARITLAISERFDADGIDDLTLPKKVTIMYILTNAKGIVKLFKEVIAIIKEKKPKVDEIEYLVQDTPELNQFGVSISEAPSNICIPSHNPNTNKYYV